MIKFYRVKGQLAVQAEWLLRGKFTGLKAYKGRYYALIRKPDKKLFIRAYIGCAWNFANKFPDFKWVLEPSLWHDIMHWLIAKGCISEDQNDLIDAEMAHVIRANAKWDWLGKARAWYIEKATNTVDQKEGEKRKVFTA